MRAATASIGLRSRVATKKNLFCPRTTGCELNVGMVGKWAEIGQGADNAVRRGSHWLTHKILGGNLVRVSHSMLKQPLI